MHSQREEIERIEEDCERRIEAQIMGHLRQVEDILEHSHMEKQQLESVVEGSFFLLLLDFPGIIVPSHYPTRSQFQQN